jgi:hypothetical protein
VSYVAQSILTSTKKILGLPEQDTSFDIDIEMHINSVLAVLTQVGIGPDGFAIDGPDATWDDFLGTDPVLNMAKTYVYLRVRLIFDTPTTSYAIDSMKAQIQEFEWRLNVHREGFEWEAPVSS